MKKLLIITHGECMDGLGAAAAAYFAHEGEYDIYVAYTIYKKEDEILKGMETLGNKVDKIIMCDFTPPIEIIEKLIPMCAELELYDHHGTAAERVEQLRVLKPDAKIVFNNDRSGAGLVFDAYEEVLKTKLDHKFSYFKTLIDYIHDRDLWQWKLALSKEISAGLWFEVGKREVPYFIKVLNRLANEDIFLTDLANNGKILLADSERKIADRIENITRIEIDGVEIGVVNATEAVSETGNAICIKYNIPALVYEITNEISEDGHIIVKCSLRSTNALADVSKIATKFGGGGHRNSAGFSTTTSSFFGTILVHTV